MGGCLALTRLGLRSAFAAVTLILVLAAKGLAEEPTGDQRFLAGLRERGLFELARTYCVEQLQDAALSQRRQADLTIELSLTLAEWATNSPPAEREPLWRDAWQVTEDFLRRYPDDPRAVLVRLQGSLGLLARGELALQEAQVVADNALLLEEARTWLREAVRALRELDVRLAAALRERNGPRRTEESPDAAELFSPYQLASIQKNVQYELARALRNQGQSYPPESPDRSNSLTQAVRMLEPLGELESAQSLAWKSRIDEIVCHRLLRDYTSAEHNLDALSAANPPANILLRGRAERIRLALAQGRLKEALDAIALGREVEGITSGDLDYAWVEAYLSAWRAAVDAGDGAAAKQRQTQASEMVQQIEQRQGPYWTRRAEMLLAGYVRGTPGTGDLAVQVRAAESSYRSGRIDDALAAYDRAGATALAKGAPDQAFELGHVAATIEHQRDRHEEALQRYRRLAMETPEHPKAPEAHALGIYHSAQLAKQSRDRLKQYVDLLEEHLRTWPEAPTADGIRWRLGSLHEHQQDWQGAVAAFREISAGDAKRVEAVEAAVRCYRAWIEARRSAGERIDEIVAEAAGWLESLVLGEGGRLPERWSPVARVSALAAAQLWLVETDSGFARAEQLLSAAIAGATDAPAAWQTAARSLLVFALAGQGKHQEAARALEQMSAGSRREVLALVMGLSRVAATARPEVKADLANLRLAALERLEVQPQAFAPEDRRALEFSRAQALRDAGRAEEAGEAFARLARQYPHNGEIQEAHAQHLLAGGDPASLQKALAKWREIEAKAPPASPRWFRAKYQVAALHYRLGNPEQAEKMIRLLEILHPELGGPQLKRQFRELLGEATR